MMQIAKAVAILCKENNLRVKIKNATEEINLEIKAAPIVQTELQNKVLSIIDAIY